MLSHIRANLWLLVLTVLICCVLYPAVLLGIGQTFFRDKANGSLILDKDKKPIGSRLIAQPFNGDEYFQPRPSAASYNGAASGASNWGANNYKLRDRVAQMLGPIVKYRGGPKKGKLVAEDIEAWFREQEDQAKVKKEPGVVAQWLKDHSGSAPTWVSADPLNTEFVAQWQGEHPKEVAAWVEKNPDTPEPKPADLAVPFFESYVETFPGTFPSAVEHKTPDGKTVKKIEPVREGGDIAKMFFDMWRQEHADADLEPVPADMVMASGSGLDPHITLKNALYQLDRVAGKWAETTKGESGKIRKEIEDLLHKKAEAPLGGLVGVELVNVLEVNLALRDRYADQAQAASR